ncbi:hypothetical protein ACIQWR_40845 [Streptomyces sp. NPDC098789]|uniref:hypothetical protein n=1 Tax=Streptomyces sp. NPDC098789 TaxID=3366098 RepID=UPI0038204836
MNAEADGVTRRRVTQMAGIGIAAMGLAAAGARAAGAKESVSADGVQPGEKTGAPSAARAVNLVNLGVTTETLTFNPNNTGSCKVTVRNFGQNATQGIVSLKVITPYYVNFGFADTNVPNPNWSFLYYDPRPHVPSILEIKIPPGLAAGGAVAVDVPFVMDPAGPIIPASGRATATPAVGSPDVDTDIVRNTQQFGVVRQSSPPTPPAARVNLHFTYSNVALPLGRATDMPVRFWNRGSARTTSPATFVMYSPFYTNFGPARSLPRNMRKLYTNPDPSVPEILEVTIPAGILPRTLGGILGVGANIPLVPVAGGPKGIEMASGIILPGPSDTDSDLTINIQQIVCLLV